MCVLTYGYKKNDSLTNGYLELLYNENDVIKIQYKSKKKFEKSYDKNHISMTIENFLKPIGILYKNQKRNYSLSNFSEYSAIELRKVFRQFTTLHCNKHN